jgi:hypothetical protein
MTTSKEKKGNTGLATTKILSHRLNEVSDLRDRLREVCLFHLQKLEDMEDSELSAKDRIELIGRVLPFITNKLAADKESSLPKRQGDPLESI